MLSSENSTKMQEWGTREHPSCDPSHHQFPETWRDIDDPSVPGVGGNGQGQGGGSFVNGIEDLSSLYP